MAGCAHVCQLSNGSVQVIARWAIVVDYHGAVFRNCVLATHRSCSRVTNDLRGVVHHATVLLALCLGVRLYAAAAAHLHPGSSLTSAPSASDAPAESYTSDSVVAVNTDDDRDIFVNAVVDERFEQPGLLTPFAVAARQFAANFPLMGVGCVGKAILLLGMWIGICVAVLVASPVSTLFFLPWATLNVVLALFRLALNANSGHLSWTQMSYTMAMIEALEHVFILCWYRYRETPSARRELLFVAYVVFVGALLRTQLIEIQRGRPT